MSSFAAASLVIVLLLSFGIPILWWIFNNGPSPDSIRDNQKKFNRRLLNPDFACFERRYGVQPPISLQSIFFDKSRNLCDQESFTVQITPGVQSENTWYVSCIYPIDEEQLSRRPWPGTESFYAFAGDGSGDQYLIKPSESDPDVFYYEHETGRLINIGTRLSQFLTAQRIYEEDT
jgi:hypothetical protein